LDDPHQPALTRAAAHFGAGQLDQAEAIYRAIVAAAPGHAVAHANLGSVLHAEGRYEAAIAALTAALQLEPVSAPMQRNLASCICDWGAHLQGQGRLDDAIALYRKALAFDGALVGAHNNLGVALLEQTRIDEAIACFRAALTLDPNNAELHFNLGAALRDAGALDNAIPCWRAALALDPTHADAGLNLGTALLHQGELAAALEHYRASVALAPDRPGAHSNLLLALAYDPTQSAAALREAACRYGMTLGGAPSAPARDRDPERRLRLGYVSADFRLHPVGWFIQAPLAFRDRARFELFCYANQTETDRLTEQLRDQTDHWRNIKTLTDDQFADQVATDRIDILIELGGHSAHNRLPALAGRLAPVQASWIGFPMTTGVATVDYLIADAHLAPPGSEPEFTETILRLPDVAWCYTAPSFAPAVAPLPARAAAGVMFGSFNNPAKLNPAVLADWAAILDRVPGSRLLIKYRHLGGRGAAAHLRAAAATAGIAMDRLLIEDASPHPEALAAYARVDIALDPFPFNGGTTSCEALWMGVPVVTFAGATLAGRMGASLVAAAGLPELVARDRAGMIEIAVALAGDLDRLATLRAALRARMASSPLCDGPRFMAGFEAALRRVWRLHCASGSP
jgi:predicted O-linked N-acetylglucosamine transferase (SPINDLY family)